jgi:hypothetical protein
MTSDLNADLASIRSGLRHHRTTGQNGRVTPTDIIRQAQSATLTDEDGEPLALEMLSPLSPAQIDAFAARLPCPLPAEIRELLGFCSGFHGPWTSSTSPASGVHSSTTRSFRTACRSPRTAAATSGSSICCRRQRAGDQSITPATTRRWCSIRARRCPTS